PSPTTRPPLARRPRLHAAEAHASRRGRAFAASPAGPLAHAAFIDRQTLPRETNCPREAGEWPFEWIR
ncbi:hypothetical protein ACX84Z_22380, partial [Burkholderia pseudomallei]